MNFQSELKGEFFPWWVLVSGFFLYFLAKPQLALWQVTHPFVNFSLAAHLLPGLATGNLIPSCSQKISGNGALETHL